MTDLSTTGAYVREQEAPRLPPPPNMTGVQGWIMQNLFPNAFNSVLTLVFGAFALWLIWDILHWAVFSATWTGDGREACIWEGAGACWPFVRAKLPQWIYGFYPIDQRWRVNICFIVGIAALVPMMMPSVPYKKWNVLFLLTAYPLMTLILLTGGNFHFDFSTYAGVVSLVLLAAAALPLLTFGIEDGIARNKLGLGLAAVALLLWLLSFALESQYISLGVMVVPLLTILIFVAAIASAFLSIGSVLSNGGLAGQSAIRSWAIALLAILAVMVVLEIDFGLVPVETSQWGGLTVTLVVSITGIVASLPLGILLALGRRSKMPIVKLFSVAFIELWRGVPLITVLFMSSVMLPLFLPEGVTFDKLLRALIGVALFSSAYMAEVVRGGLQAIPRGQYEGAMALGLSYWQMMNKIILPQALKISIPNIVSNFIGLFKDTTLVSIIGIFDLLGVVQSGFADAKWASPHSAPTGYFTAALIFWIFCFGMSRYSIYTERRLATGHKR
jgi:general L-amino acid transport system permease protein